MLQLCNVAFAQLLIVPRVGDGPASQSWDTLGGDKAAATARTVVMPQTLLLWHRAMSDWVSEGNMFEIANTEYVVSQPVRQAAAICVLEFGLRASMVSCCCACRRGRAVPGPQRNPHCWSPTLTSTTPLCTCSARDSSQGSVRTCVPTGSSSQLATRAWF